MLSFSPPPPPRPLPSPAQPITQPPTLTSTQSDLSRYVILSGALTTFVGFWHGAVVTSARKAAGVPYPYHYASKEQVESADSDSLRDRLHRFNCAQRAHGNFQENHPSVLSMIMVAGLRYPLAAAGLGAWWSLNRVLFALGYMDPSKKDGAGRYRGIGQYIGFLGLIGLTIKSGIDLILA